MRGNKSDVGSSLLKQYFYSFLTSVTLPFHKGGVQVEKNAIYIKLQSKVGITVMWNSDDAVMVKTTIVMHKSFRLI